METDENIDKKRCTEIKGSEMGSGVRKLKGAKIKGKKGFERAEICLSVHHIILMPKHICFGMVWYGGLQAGPA